MKQNTIVKPLEDSGLLLKGVSDIVQNKAKAFLSILLGTLGACLLRNISADRGKNRAGEGVVRAGYGRRCSKNKKNWFLMPSHPLTNFEIQKYCQNESTILFIIFWNFAMF